MKRISMIVLSLLLVALLLGSAAWAETESADVENPMEIKNQVLQSSENIAPQFSDANRRGDDRP